MFVEFQRKRNRLQIMRKSYNGSHIRQTAKALHTFYSNPTHTTTQQFVNASQFLLFLLCYFFASLEFFYSKTETFFNICFLFYVCQYSNVDVLLVSDITWQKERNIIKGKYTKFCRFCVRMETKKNFSVYIFNSRFSN